jgi:hypothetical protein
MWHSQDVEPLQAILEKQVEFDTWIPRVDLIGCHPIEIKLKRVHFSNWEHKIATPVKRIVEKTQRSQLINISSHLLINNRYQKDHVFFSVIM